MRSNLIVLQENYVRDRPFYYITNSVEANNILLHVIRGPIGFDTEFQSRKLSDEEVTWYSRSKAEKLRYQRSIRPAPARADKLHPDQRVTGLCIVQIAVRDAVYVLHVKRMDDIPAELKRIVESDEIAKVGFALNADAGKFWEDYGWNARNLVDIGFMVRLTHPIPYRQHSGGVGLDDCVARLKNKAVDKSLSTCGEWTEELSAAKINYAGLDAQASLEMFDLVSYELDIKEKELERQIPSAWYTYNFIEGALQRVVLDIDGETIEWKFTDCPWYVGGRFSNYHM